MTLFKAEKAACNISYLSNHRGLTVFSADNCIMKRSVIQYKTALRRQLNCFDYSRAQIQDTRKAAM